MEILIFIECMLWKYEVIFTFDVWLTVHRSSTWNKKPTRCHLVLYLCYVLLNGHTTSQPDLTAYTATALHHTRQKIPLSPQLLRMGTRWPETCWATYKGEINIILIFTCLSTMDRPVCVRKLEACFCKIITAEWEINVRDVNNYVAKLTARRCLEICLLL